MKISPVSNKLQDEAEREKEQERDKKEIFKIALKILQ